MLFSSLFTFDLVEGECARMRVQPIGPRRGFPRLQRAKPFTDRAILDAALHGEQRLGRVIAEGSRKADLFFRRIASGMKIGCAGLRQKVRGETLNSTLHVRFRRLGHDGKRRPAETFDTKEARAQGQPLFLAESGWIVALSEHERPRNGSFAWICRPVEHECVRRVEPDGPWKLQHLLFTQAWSREGRDHTKIPA